MFSVYAQNIAVTGIITDESGEPMPGASIRVEGSTRGVSTDLDGTYSISVQPSDKLEITFVGYETVMIPVGSQRKIDVQLKPKPNELDEVTVVAFAKQKKESVIASISTVTPAELKVPSSNLTTAFAGRIAGLISYQRTGEPGQDNADFFIRGVTTFGTGKKDPLILIDGVEMTTEDLSRLTTDDIAAFSIMKDANATALYGSRGANGVILVSTKEGREGKAKVQLRLEGSFSQPTRNVDLVDPVNYMKLHNEAVITRTPGSPLPYSQSKISYTERALKGESGIDPVRYPANDWQDLLFDKRTFNQRYNLNVSGGGTVARYYIAAAYAKDQGIIKNDSRNSFSNNIDIRKYSLRSNVNVNITKSTEIIVRLSGSFDDYQGPLDGGTDLYKKAINANPVYFQPYYEPDEANKFAKHVLYGNYPSGGYLNPYTEMTKGYKSEDRSTMYAQFELKQDFDFLLKGLSARALFNVNRYSRVPIRRAITPFFYSLAETADQSLYILNQINEDGKDYLQFLDSSRSLENTLYFEGALMYNNTFAEKHTVSGLMVYTVREKKDGGTDNLQLALPSRNLSLAGRFTYSYDDRYFIEGNFGYNGSERFHSSHRWGFFPSVGAGWIISNEGFMESYKKVISMLKLKATYGLVGNDAIGRNEDRFFYMSEVNMNDNNRGYSFGNPYVSINGISISRYADPGITWEISRKSNFGLELNLWNSLEIQVDYFREKRKNILQTRSDLPSTMGIQNLDNLRANIGKAKSNGVEVSVDYNKSFTPDLWAVIRGTFTYAVGEYDVYEEPDYLLAPWRSRVGNKLSQTYGLVAERLFVDEEEVANAPLQTFGEYGAGDIKYKDISRDGRIDANDQVPIGFPTDPEIIYGFGISAGYKGFDFSCFFQGSARSSFWINPSATAPFVNDNTTQTGVPDWQTNRAMLQDYADSYWSEDNRDIYALWPRLSENTLSNNTQTSTWFMRSGSFLRLKTAEIGYTLPSKLTNKLWIQSLRIYVSGSNLAVISAFKMWDPEMAGNGLAYPLQRVYNIGLNIEF
jgi:TonB-linked SusC/RagA family outer membrane protein